VRSPEKSLNNSILALLQVILFKQVKIELRYIINTVSQFLTIYIFFAIIFFGGQAVAGAALSNSLNGIIVGFFLFTMAISAYSGIAYNVTEESQWGTLERLFMSTHGFGRVMVVKAFVNVLMTLVWASILLVAMMATSGRWLSIDLITIVPLTIITLASVIGVGFAFAGVALLHKRLENLIQLVQFGFVGLLGAPVESFPALKLLPLANGSHLLQQAMTQGLRLWELPPEEIAIMTAVSVAYFAIGYYLFQRLLRRARRKGLMAHY